MSLCSTCGRRPTLDVICVRCRGRQCFTCCLDQIPVTATLDLAQVRIPRPELVW